MSRYRYHSVTRGAVRTLRNLEQPPTAGIPNFSGVATWVTQKGSEMSAVLAGLGACLPEKRVTNEELCRYLDTTSEWIESRTGILERRVVAGGLATGDLAVAAGRRALGSAGVEQVGAVVVATTSPDRLCPATAPEVAYRLGQGHVPAYDLASACSGFLYGLATAAGLIAAGVADSVLFVGAEAFTTLVNPADRGTAAIFGDGAGAIVLRRGEPDEPGAVGAFDLGSDGARADLLAIPAGGSRQRSRDGGLGHRGTAVSDWYLNMEGPALFVQAVNRMSGSARRALDLSGWTVEDLDWFVAHQANLRIVRAVAEELDIPQASCATNIRHAGNTLAASIPVLLTEAAANGGLHAGDRVLLSAFGAGLSWGSTVMTWPQISVDDVLSLPNTHHKEQP
jgi:3-oxoacyl-[acyl-carrier-protein] synthase-3